MYVINFLVIVLDLYIHVIYVPMLFFKISSNDVHVSYRSEWPPDLVFGL